MCFFNHHCRFVNNCSNGKAVSGPFCNSLTKPAVPRNPAAISGSLISLPNGLVAPGVLQIRGMVHCATTVHTAEWNAAALCDCSRLQSNGFMPTYILHCSSPGRAGESSKIMTKHHLARTQSPTNQRWQNSLITELSTQEPGSTEESSSVFKWHTVQDNRG